VLILVGFWALVKTNPTSCKSIIFSNNFLKAKKISNDLLFAVDALNSINEIRWRSLYDVVLMQSNALFD